MPTGGEGGGGCQLGLWKASKGLADKFDGFIDANFCDYSQIDLKDKAFTAVTAVKRDAKF